MESDFIYGLFTGMVVLTISLIMLIAIANPVVLSHKTTNEICSNITGNSHAIGNGEYNKLICTFPSTTNIIIKGKEKCNN